MLYLGSQITSEVRYLRADDPPARFEVVHPRQHRMEYTVEHWGDKFYIVTNDEAINFQVVEAPRLRSRKEELEGRDPAPRRRQDRRRRGRSAPTWSWRCRENGLRGLRVIDLPAWTEHKVEFPEPVYTVRGGENPEFESSTLRFGLPVAGHARVGLRLRHEHARA